MHLLARAHRRFFLRHPLQLGLAVFGIAIGVAAAAAVDVSVNSARLAFQLSMQSLLGTTTHQVIGSGRGLPESLYPELRREFPEISMRPVIESLVDVGGEPYRLLGIDVFAAAGAGGEADPSQIARLVPALLVQPTAVLMSKLSGRRAGIHAGDNPCR